MLIDIIKTMCVCVHVCCFYVLRRLKTKTKTQYTETTQLYCTLQIQIPRQIQTLNTNYQIQNVKLLIQNIPNEWQLAISIPTLILQKYNYIKINNNTNNTTKQQKSQQYQKY